MFQKIGFEREKVETRGYRNNSLSATYKKANTPFLMKAASLVSSKNIAHLKERKKSRPRQKSTKRV